MCRLSRRRTIQELESKARELEDELNSLRKKPGYKIVPLDKPYRVGFYRQFVLRDDALNREDAHVLAEILQTCYNANVFCKNRTFTRKTFKGRIEDIQGPNLHVLRKNKWSPYNALSERAKSYFVEGWYVEHYRYSFYSGPSYYRAYALKGKYRRYFVHHIRGAYVREQYVPYPEHKSREAEIQNHLYTHNLYPLLNKMHGYSRDSYYWIEGQRKREQELERAANEEIQEVLASL